MMHFFGESKSLKNILERLKSNVGIHYTLEYDNLHLS